MLEANSADRAEPAGWTASCSTRTVCAATLFQLSPAPIRVDSARAAASAAGSSSSALIAPAIAPGSSKGTSTPAPVLNRSSAYRYGVDTTGQPAATAKVRAPDTICSRERYGVR